VDSKKDEKVLVCDDDDQFRASMRKVLEREGYCVAVASNGKEAIEKSKELYYDLLILDIRMPDMDGIEALKQIREIHGDRPSAVIIVTGFASEDAPVEALRMGVSDYLVKPFDMSDFLHSVNKNIELVSALKDREYFYKRLLEKNEQVKLTETELSELKKRLENHSI